MSARSPNAHHARTVSAGRPRSPSCWAGPTPRRPAVRVGVQDDRRPFVSGANTASNAAGGAPRLTNTIGNASGERRERRSSTKTPFSFLDRSRTEKTRPPPRSKSPARRRPSRRSRGPSAPSARRRPGAASRRFGSTRRFLVRGARARPGRQHRRSAPGGDAPRRRRSRRTRPRPSTRRRTAAHPGARPERERTRRGAARPARRPRWPRGKVPHRHDVRVDGFGVQRFVFRRNVLPAGLGSSGRDHHPGVVVADIQRGGGSCRRDARAALAGDAPKTRSASRVPALKSARATPVATQRARRRRARRRRRTPRTPRRARGRARSPRPRLRARRTSRATPRAPPGATARAPARTRPPTRRGGAVPGRARARTPSRPPGP